MYNPILLLSAFLLGMGMFNWTKVKPVLIDFKYWLDHGDPGVTITVALIIGLFLAAAASWVMM